MFRQRRTFLQTLSPDHTKGVNCPMSDQPTGDKPQGNLSDLDQYKNKASSAEMAEASLNGVPGQGTLHVVRDHAAEVFEIGGTWRQSDELDEQDVSSLREAFENETPVMYNGQLSDSEHPDKDHIEIEVKLTSVQSYFYDDHEDSSGKERTLFNFTLPGSLPYGEAPSDKA